MIEPLRKSAIWPVFVAIPKGESVEFLQECEGWGAFSLERLMDFLTALGQHVEITVRLTETLHSLNGKEVREDQSNNFFLYPYGLTSIQIHYNRC